ncbi:MAG: Rpn family recombination-promoting nuclease/putative transposase [Gallionella sp.]|nr:Rpn family recombination-promoting nuclease/putative transposase [Gallionella sp.]
MRFLDVKTDYAFKRVFGSEGSKPVLTSFLNAVLDYQGKQAIVDLTIIDPYQIPMLQGMKDTCVDVKAVLANGKHVIIEMQVLSVPGFEKRILHNAATGHGIDITTEGVTRHARLPLLNPLPLRWRGSENPLSSILSRLRERMRTRKAIVSS